jgi:effector-binding domain-containing protein
MRDVELVQQRPQPAAVVRGHLGTEQLPLFLAGAYEDTMRTIGEQGQAPSGPPFARYERDGGRFSVVAGFPCEHRIQPSGRVEGETLPGGLVARTMYQGDYGGIGVAYDEMQSWLTEHGYTMSGPVWESYLDEPEVKRPRTIMQVPCLPVAEPETAG